MSEIITLDSVTAVDDRVDVVGDGELLDPLVCAGLGGTYHSDTVTCRWRHVVTDTLDGQVSCTEHNRTC